MMRFLSRLFSSDQGPPGSSRGAIVLAPDSPPEGGTWRASGSAYVDIQASIIVLNTARRGVEMLHIDVGRPNAVGDPPDVRARFCPQEAPAGVPLPVTFSVRASPIFPTDGIWLYADVILLVDEGRRHRLSSVKFRRVNG